MHPSVDLDDPHERHQQLVALDAEVRDILDYLRQSQFPLDQATFDKLAADYRIVERHTPVDDRSDLCRHLGRRIETTLTVLRERHVT